MSIIDKAKELSGQAVEKAGDLGGDDLIVNTIIRLAEKKERINKLLEEQGCDYRISGIDVENGIPPKASFSVERESE
ncbi:MAG: hypothetical protein BA865_14125 [Desulfobacterales bacterium S5133MH4]|nr:MAG: hypothetical protein BA865_14125 [Desulfobacterales bacterium S5133MH4]